MTESTKARKEVRVQADSLPHCLRHCNAASALDDARKLVSLLSEIAYLNLVASEAGAGSRKDYLSAGGFDLLVDLIRDKLDIASGRYNFPLIGCSDSPNLAERVED